MAILGGYTGLYLIVKMKSAVSGKKVEEAVAAPASSGAVATTGMPPKRPEEQHIEIPVSVWNDLNLKALKS